MMPIPSPASQRSTHRALWVVAHPLLTWGLSALAVIQYDLPEAVRAAVALLFLFYPLVLYLRWRDQDTYRARSYGYAVAIAFCGVALCAGTALLFGMVLGSASWR